MARPVKAKDICNQVIKDDEWRFNIIKTCSRCGKEFDMNTCETYADIQYIICHVSKDTGRFGKYILCKDCEHDFEFFMFEKYAEDTEYGQTSQS
jgi:hypothetical protein|nr:MAG TPA: RNA polymerase-like protein [Caudoviricetes sp.]